MAFWDCDLTTRMGAETATSQGASICFIFTGLTILGAAFAAWHAGYDTPTGIATIAAGGAEALIALITGLRMRVGKGAFWGLALALLAGSELILKVVTLQIGVGIVINIVVLVVLINGVRGAFALRKDKGFVEDDVEVFE